MPGPNTFSRRREHPYQAKNLTDLPVELRQLAERSLGLDGQVNLIFVVPPQVFPGSSWGGPRYVPEQALLFTPLGVLHVQSTAAPRQAGQATYLHGAELVYARLSLLLLYGRVGIGRAGQWRFVPRHRRVQHRRPRFTAAGVVAILAFSVGTSSGTREPGPHRYSLVQPRRAIVQIQKRAALLCAAA